MGEKFNAYIDNINPEFWHELCVGTGNLRSYDADEEFVSVGTAGRYLGFVESGACKYVAYGEDGTEHVVGLIFPGEFVADFPFCLYGQPSRVSIVATRPSEIYVVSSTEIAHRLREDEELRQNVMSSTEALFATTYDRYISLYAKSPAQRYEELITNHPELFDTFSLKEIASFLKITPTHLSRLRKR